MATQARPSQTRIYLVTIGAVDRLVRAAHPSLALMHVARDIARVDVASQDDLVNCVSDGIDVEDAGRERRGKRAAAGAEPGPGPVPEVDPRQADIFGALAAQAPTQAAPKPEPEPAAVWAMPQPAVKAAEDFELDNEEPCWPMPDDQPPAAAPARKSSPPAKFRCPQTLSTWSGRGLQPRWLKVALSNGAALADFAAA